MPKTIIWKLTAGKMDGQETAEQKLEEGMKYVQKLRNGGDTILEVKNEGDKLVIIAE